MSCRRLVSQVLMIREVDVQLRSCLFALMQRCFHCITRERFEADLAEKDYLIVLFDASGTPRGFSTQMVFRRQWKDQSIQVLFSGDTVIEPAFWGSHELAKGWCKVAAMVMQENPGHRLFWFLISKGFRTYLYLPLFFQDYYPHCDTTQDSDTRALLTTLAKDKFGSAFHLQSGILRFQESLGQLTPELAEIPAARLQDRHVQFFLKLNPHYASGDELACLAEVSLENTHGLGRRWLRQAMETIAHND